MAFLSTWVLHLTMKSSLYGQRLRVNTSFVPFGNVLTKKNFRTNSLGGLTSLSPSHWSVCFLSPYVSPLLSVVILAHMRVCMYGRGYI